MCVFSVSFPCTSCFNYTCDFVDNLDKLTPMNCSNLPSQMKAISHKKDNVYEAYSLLHVYRLYLFVDHHPPTVPIRLTPASHYW